MSSMSTSSSSTSSNSTLSSSWKARRGGSASPSQSRLEISTRGERTSPGPKVSVSLIFAVSGSSPYAFKFLASSVCERRGEVSRAQGFERRPPWGVQSRLLVS